MSINIGHSLALIDGKFLHKAARHFNAPIDYAKLRKWLEARGFDMLWYYNSVVYKDDEEDQSVVKLFDYLGTNGYLVDIQELFEDEQPQGFDVAMACRAILNMNSHRDIMFVSAGPSLLPAIKTIHNASSARVHLLSLWLNKAGVPSSSMEMKKAAWTYYDLGNIIDEIKQNGKPK